LWLHLARPGLAALASPPPSHHPSPAVTQFLETGGESRFVERVEEEKERCLREMLSADEVPLRKGAGEMVGEVLSSGTSGTAPCRLVLVCGTASAADANAGASAARLLVEGGWVPSVEDVVRITVPGALGGVDDGGRSEDVDGGGSLSLGAAMAEAKVEAARSAVTALEAAQGSTLSLHPTLLAAASGRAGATPAWLSACCALIGVSPADAVLLASGSSVIAAAAGAGIWAGSVPADLDRDGSAPGAEAKFDGFGPGGGVTWDKVCRLSARLREGDKRLRLNR